MIHFKQMIEIMCGKETCIQQVMDKWQEGLAAILIYQCSTVQVTDIQ
jgi:hypothetical protein